VHLCCHKFGQKNHTTTCRARRYAGIPVIRSKKHGYEASGLGFHQNTMILHTRASRHMKFRATDEEDENGDGTSSCHHLTAL
jgi:hypothetical protein